MNGLFMAAAGAVSQLAHLDTVASNLANATTPGFRRLQQVVQAVSGGAYEYPASQAAVDLSQGPVNATGNPLDVALAGPAFITVQTAQGPAYTRDGELQIGPDGTLLAAGQPVTAAGEQGGPIKLPPGPLTIGADGSLEVAGAPIGKIALADPAGVTMTPLGGNLYVPAEGGSLPPVADNGTSFHQGFVEGAGGSAIGSMVSMMGVMRSYEAAMHAVQAIDENQDHTIQTFTLQA